LECEQFIIGPRLQIVWEKTNKQKALLSICHNRVNQGSRIRRNGCWKSYIGANLVEVVTLSS